MTRQQDQIGKHGQSIAASVLSGMGVNMVEHIGTPVKLVPHFHGSFMVPNVYTVIFGEKVSGDHRGVLDNGISVLAETKTIMDRNLRWSDLREHQPDRLIEHAKYGGLSLLVWVHSSGVYVMIFPIEGFGAGKRFTIEQARQEHKKTSITLDKILKKKDGL